jgi:hypothetical protein
MEITHDVRPELYVSVIRELIRHEDDVTNHRIMWLLVVQGLLVNAYVNARDAHDVHADTVIALAGILVTLSAFLMLYKSYHARGYLHFLGLEAQQGRLPAEYLRFDGWPRKRIKNWREKNLWLCPWLERVTDLLEPYLFLPTLIVSTWMFVLLQRRIPVAPLKVLGLALALTTAILVLFRLTWIRLQAREEEAPTEEPVGERK